MPLAYIVKSLLFLLRKENTGRVKKQICPNLFFAALLMDQFGRVRPVRWYCSFFARVRLRLQTLYFAGHSRGPQAAIIADARFGFFEVEFARRAQQVSAFAQIVQPYESLGQHCLCGRDGRSLSPSAISPAEIEGAYSSPLFPGCALQRKGLLIATLPSWMR
jgi:hypothetical protein